MRTDTEDPSKSANCIQIKRDLNRTFPTCTYFTEGHTGQADMERVLSAYAKYDAQIGYVQGMNFVVGALLYHCSEEIAFWLFVSLIEDYEIRDIYLPGTPPRNQSVDRTARTVQAHADHRHAHHGESPRRLQSHCIPLFHHIPRRSVSMR